ncbi:hypothetical protein GQ600_7950 [Phytophthora cactorum]|nr:hypothetical protein GQ600_7950 [Phytophthora cactorum]
MLDGLSSLHLEYACGPFIEVAKGYTPLLSYITSSGVASAFYSLYLATILCHGRFCSCFCLPFSSFGTHSPSTLYMTTFQREQDVALTFSSLRRKIRQLENRLRLQKMGGGRASEAVGNEYIADH